MHYALFARAGFTDAARSLAAERGATMVDLEELGRELEGELERLTATAVPSGAT